MDQQHPGYESFNDFGGFVNAFASGSENNYSLQQPQQPSSHPTTLMNEYDARAIGNSSLYELPQPQQPSTSQQYSHLQFQYHDLAASSSLNKCPPPNEVVAQNNDTEKSLISSNIENPQMPSQSTIKTTSETVNFDPSQNSMLKALGVVRKDVLGASSSKKRRRIVLLNDDEDSDDGNELKNEMKLNEHEDENSKKDNNNEQRDSEGGGEADGESEHEEPENLTDLGALKAKFLLKNAVIIQDPDKKKKKKPRLLDSDDEEPQLMQTTSVDDIGMLNENENEEESFENDILIAEPVIPIENPIIADECVDEMPEKPPEEVIEEKNDEKLQAQEEVAEKLESQLEKIEDTPILTASPATTSAPAATTDINNQSEQKESKDILPKTKDEQNKGATNEEENEIDPSMSVEAILENIKPMADDDEFFKFDKSDEEKNQDKNLTNEEYFGTPDKSKPGAIKGKKRGPKVGSKRTMQDPSLRRKRGDRYEDDFVDDSESEGSSDSDYTDSSSSSESSVEEVRPRGRPPLARPGPGRPPMKMKVHHPFSRGPGRPPLDRKPPAPMIMPTKSYSFTPFPIPMKKKIKRDRFYDRSRDIPNEVYFGDVNVPLHVLHTKWGSDNDSDDEFFRSNPSPARSYNASYNSMPSTSKSSFGYSRPQVYIHDEADEPKLSNLKEFIHICGIKINYQKLFDGIKSTDHKCMLLRRIMAQKGLQGEPTVAKCKKVRRELQAKRESAELDKSVIINAEGRTRRSVRSATRVASYAEERDDDVRIVTPVTVQPETLETLSKIRKVIDSDSE